MPVIARFYGMIVKMYYQQREHNPPHIHVIYGECIGVVNVQTLVMLEGHLPAKELAMLRAWMDHYRIELLNMWETQEFKQLPPLE